MDTTNLIGKKYLKNQYIVRYCPKCKRRKRIIEKRTKTFILRLICSKCGKMYKPTKKDLR